MLSLESAKQDFKINCNESGELPPSFQKGLKRRRLSRWDRFTISGAQSLERFPDHFLSTLPSDVANSLALRLRLVETTSILTGEEVLPVSRPECRSPSPPATYDEHGKRNNTREHRKRVSLARERQYLVDDAVKLNPKFRPPADFKPVTLKKTSKLYVPEKEFPNYNFIGIILGPRGSTQKELEMQTGAKIAIRGRGSTRDGRDMRGRQEGDDEDLHVLIVADTDAQMAAAVKRVRELLTPIDEGHNEHKRNQLRKLAEFNGTLTTRDRNPDFIRQQFQSPAAAVKCSLCGETSHPSIDCPTVLAGGMLHSQQSTELEPSDAMDAAYAECMAAMQQLPDYAPQPTPTDFSRAQQPQPQPQPMAPSIQPHSATTPLYTHAPLQHPEAATTQEELPPWMLD